MDADEGDVFTEVRRITSWIKETLLFRVLGVLESFVSSHSGEVNQQQKGSVLAGKIRTGLVNFFNLICNRSYFVVRESGYMATHTLILSRFCIEMSKGVLESVLSMYNDRLFRGLEEDAGLIHTLNDTFKSSSQVDS